MNKKELSSLKKLLAAAESALHKQNVFVESEEFKATVSSAREMSPKDLVRITRHEAIREIKAHILSKNTTGKFNGNLAKCDLSGNNFLSDPNKGETLSQGPLILLRIFNELKDELAAESKHEISAAEEALSEAKKLFDKAKTVGNPNSNERNTALATARSAIEKASKNLAAVKAGAGGMKLELDMSGFNFFGADISGMDFRGCKSLFGTNFEETRAGLTAGKKPVIFGTTVKHGSRDVPFFRGAWLATDLDFSKINCYFRPPFKTEFLNANGKKITLQNAILARKPHGDTIDNADVSSMAGGDAVPSKIYGNARIIHMKDWHTGGGRFVQIPRAVDPTHLDKVANIPLNADTVGSFDDNDPEELSDAEEAKLRKEEKKEEKAGTKKASSSSSKVEEESVGAISADGPGSVKNVVLPVANNEDLQKRVVSEAASTSAHDAGTQDILKQHGMDVIKYHKPSDVKEFLASVMKETPREDEVKELSALYDKLVDINNEYLELFGDLNKNITSPATEYWEEKPLFADFGDLFTSVYMMLTGKVTEKLKKKRKTDAMQYVANVIGLGKETADEVLNSLGEEGKNARNIFKMKELAKEYKATIEKIESFTTNLFKKRAMLESTVTESTTPYKKGVKVVITKGDKRFGINVGDVHTIHEVNYAIDRPDKPMYRLSGVKLMWLGDGWFKRAAGNTEVKTESTDGDFVPATSADQVDREYLTRFCQLVVDSIYDTDVKDGDISANFFPIYAGDQCRDQLWMGHAKGIITPEMKDNARTIGSELAIAKLAEANK